jgi:hypothetical protein
MIHVVDEVEEAIFYPFDACGNKSRCFLIQEK